MEMVSNYPLVTRKFDLVLADAAGNSTTTFAPVSLPPVKRGVLGSPLPQRVQRRSLRTFRTTWAKGSHGVNWYAIAVIMEGVSRVTSSGERTQLSESSCCTGDACQGVWWEQVNIRWTPEVVGIATKLLVRVTIFIAREIRSITRVTRLIFRVTGLMVRATRVTRLMTRVTRLMTKVTRCGSYRVSKFLISPVHHISVWVAVMLGRRKGLARILESEKYFWWLWL